MNKLKVKPIDIINAAIAEVYGKQAVVLLTLFSTLNNKGKEKEEIEVYQNKLAAICSTVPKSWGQHVRAMYKSYLYTAEYLDEFKEYIAGRLREIYDSNKRDYYWGT